MTPFALLFIHFLSIIMVVTVLVCAWKIRHKVAAKELFVASILLCIWAVSSLLELVSLSFSAMIFWRDVTQIGTFLTPVATLSFVLAYTGYAEKHKKKLLTILYIYQGFGVALIWTDRFFHIMRISIETVAVSSYQTILVQSTNFGKLFIAGNFVLFFIAFGMLLFSLITSKERINKQVYSVLLGIALPLVFAFLKTIWEGRLFEMIPISSVFSLTGIFMLLGLLRYDLLRITPLAHQQVFYSLGEGIVICDANTHILDANPIAHDLFGESLKKVETQLYTLVPHWDRVSERVETVEVLLEEQKKNLQIHRYPIINSVDVVIGFVMLIKDVTKEKEYLKLLKMKAERDGLTLLYNRQTFIELVEERLLHTRQQVHLFYADLDHFKNINDMYGHRVGDEMLSQLGAMIRDSIDDQFLAGRMGGEEFALFAIGRGHEQMVDVAQKIRSKVAETSFVCKDTSLFVTISIGLVTTKDYPFDAMYLLADRLLYQAKQEGRNCVRHTSVIHENL